jgi:hypothetical protein
MKRLALVWVVLGLFGGGATVAHAQEKDAGMKTSAIAQTPEWLTIKSLVGSWGGVVEIEGKQVPTSVEMRLTGDGSAVMHVMDKDTPHEMVTMFHPDGERLLATHYCAAHNQPRMALVKAAKANQIAFEFVDGTNIRPGDEHMQRLVLTITDADHHDETWTSGSDGKGGPPMTFSYTRKK